MTSFEYRLHPVGPQVFVCFVFYPAGCARQVLGFCGRYTSRAPEDVAPLAFFGRVPVAEEFPPESHGEPYVTLLAVYPSDPGEGEQVLHPLRELGDPITDLSGTMPYTEAQVILDEDYRNGWRYYWKSVNVRP